MSINKLEPLQMWHKRLNHKQTKIKLIDGESSIKRTDMEIIEKVISLMHINDDRACYHLFTIWIEMVL